MSLFSLLTTLVAPHDCVICGRTTTAPEGHLCEWCLYSLPSYAGFGAKMPEIADRFLRRMEFYSANALLRYDRGNVVSELIKDFKYNGMQGVGRRLGERLGAEFASHTLSLQADVIVPMPIHILKRMRRGYNQTEILATAVSEKLAIPVERQLRATRPHSTQTRKSLLQRRQGITADYFRVKNPEALRGKHILLLDDVITTGSTMVAAASAISRDVPSATISLLALAATAD